MQCQTQQPFKQAIQGARQFKPGAAQGVIEEYMADPDGQTLARELARALKEETGEGMPPPPTSLPPLP